MKTIEKDDFDKVERPAEEPQVSQSYELDPAQLKALVARLDNPLDLQKELAAQLHIFMDRSLHRDLSTTGQVSKNTLNLIKDLNEALDRIHKNIHGEKVAGILELKVSHSDIAAKMREFAPKAIKTIDVDVVEPDEETP